MPSYLYPLLTVVQVIAALSVIVLVLLQQGKGADMGSSFGGGSAGSLFGATGAANFFSRATKWVAVLFFAATAALAYLGNMSPNSEQPGQSNGAGLMEGYQPQNPALPMAPPAGGAVPSAGSLATPVAPQAVTVPVAPAKEASAPAAAVPAKQDTVVETPKETAPVSEKPTESVPQ